ncbi:hypothetical protein F8144_20775 [Streptomyces triticiradicis]|uniref:Uncharacterized protein n=1 Tax=Streptomyces triticiradicis TaxID=2651189 RepID=A0A7J5DD39_9ACTN|nr:hypothetical protein F8144_20775 [Streptomyces triticiradicis]
MALICPRVASSDFHARSVGPAGGPRASRVGAGSLPQPVRPRSRAGPVGGFGGNRPPTGPGAALAFPPRGPLPARSLPTARSP